MIVQSVTAAGVAEIDWNAVGKCLYAVDFGEGDPSCLLAVINGVTAGRTLLLTAGVHGDEYEGPAALTELLQTIDPAHLTGRLIIMPVLNPTGLVRRQRRAIDGRDLNRSFPGRPDGSLSERVAHTLGEAIIPRADVVFDLHAGGVDHAILSSVIINRRATIAEADAAVDAALAFGAPAAILMLQDGHDAMLDWAAERQGKIFGCAEIGSLGAITPTTLGIARAGVTNLMVHAGLIKTGPPQTTSRIRLFSAIRPECNIMADDDGLFVPALHLGDEIEEHGTIGQLIHPDRPDRKPAEIKSVLAGEAYILHAGGPIRQGDLIATIAQPVEGEELRRLARPVPIPGSAP